MQGDTLDAGADGTTDGTADRPGGAARPAEPGRADADRRLLLAVGHLLIGASLLALWAAADAWHAVTQLGAGAALSVLLAIPAGIVFSTLVHEWCHLLGARLAGARYRVPARFGLFSFDFDYQGNSVAQFRRMTYGGQLGSALAVVLLLLAIPVDTAGRAMLVAAAIGSGVFGALIEWPVLARVGKGIEPLAALGGIDRELLYRSAGKALLVMLVAWLLIG